MPQNLNQLLHRNHPVLQGARLLSGQEVLRDGDETACVSTLLSLDGEQWRQIPSELFGRTVEWAIGDEYGDMDRRERIYIRGRQTGGTPLSTLRWIARLCKEVRLQQNANRIKKRKLAGLRAEKRKMQARLRLVEGLLR